MLSIKYNKEKTQLINMIKNLIRVLIMDLLKMVDLTVVHLKIILI